jgi:hypothetical protein
MLTPRAATEADIDAMWALRTRAVIAEDGGAMLGFGVLNLR